MPALDGERLRRRFESLAELVEKVPEIRIVPVSNHCAAARRRHISCYTEVEASRGGPAFGARTFHDGR